MTYIITEGGLRSKGFSADGFRQLFYAADDHQLVVSSPMCDKAALKRMGGSFRRKRPIGWAWYFSEDNLRELLINIPFDTLDPAIEDVIKQEQKRHTALEQIKQADGLNVCLRVPNIKVRDNRTLRNYQKIGIQFGIKTRKAVLNSDEMGLGKTVQTIAIALWKKHYDKIDSCLIIAPASVKYNWEDEIKLWSDETYTVVDGNAKTRREQWGQDTFFKIVNFESMINDADVSGVVDREWGMIAIDEIHMIKSRKSKRSKFSKKLNIAENGIRIGMSGTPVDGRLEELHSIFEFLVPGLFCSFTRFMNHHAVKDFWGSVVSYKHINEVRRKIDPFFIRRLKKDVAPELPEKIFKTVYVTLTPPEMNFYNKLVKGCTEVTEDAEAMVIVIRARQYCDAPGLIGESPRLGSKAKMVVEMLTEVIDNGNKVLVFSMFEQMVELLACAFDEIGWNFVKITGRVGKKERIDVAKQFNEDPDVNICLMDEAGSTGINLQAASYVFHYDDNWSPAIMKQRTDRAHRITTQHTVTVLNFVCCNTVEDRVRKLLQHKDMLSSDVLGDNFNDVAAIKKLSTSAVLRTL